MVLSSRTFVRATCAMTGTIIGAGVFGLPSVFARIGLVWGTLLYLGLACVVTAMHLLYVEVHLAVGGSHRLAGAAKRILGPFFGKLAAITYPAHIFGTSLIYILLGGGFLTALGAAAGFAWPVRVLQFIYWIVVGVLVYRGLRSLARIETWATVILMLLLAIVSFVAWETEGWAFPSLLFAWDGSAVPLGILVFSLMGLPVVGEVVELTRRDRASAYHAVITGTLLAALLSWFFGVSWALIVLPPLSMGEAFHLPIALQGVTVLMSLVGLFAVLTSHLTSATDLLATFHHDFGFAKHHAWIVTLIPPLLLLFVFKQDILHLMNTVGALFSAFNATLVCLMALVLALRSPLRTSWVIGVSALLTGMVFVAILLEKLAHFLSPLV